MRGERERQANIMLAVTPGASVPDDQSRAPVDPARAPAQGSLLSALFSVRSERQFCEQLRYNRLFKWFLDLNVEDEPFNATTFSKNRERLLEADGVARLLRRGGGRGGPPVAAFGRPLQRGRDAPGGVLRQLHASIKGYCGRRSSPSRTTRRMDVQPAQTRTGLRALPEDICPESEAGQAG